MVGGTFAVESSPGQATIVRVEIPSAMDPPPTAPPESPDNTYPESP